MSEREREREKKESKREREIEKHGRKKDRKKERKIERKKERRERIIYLLPVVEHESAGDGFEMASHCSVSLSD